MVDRTRSRRHIPFCPTMPEYVDRYSWPDKDLRVHDCQDGYFHNVYNCAGEISFSLPLENWPRLGTVSNDIALSEPVHFHSRDPRTARKIKQHYMPKYTDAQLEGMYTRGTEYENPILRKY
jgi:hypothetical protein